MEHIDLICSLDSKLFFDISCSIEIPFRKRDFPKKNYQIFIQAIEYHHDGNGEPQKALPPPGVAIPRLALELK